MITTQRYLSVKQLILGNKESHTESLKCWTEGADDIFTYRSWVSLYLVFKVFEEIMNRKPIVLFPEYYCNDTIVNLRNCAVVNYYGINGDLSVDINSISEKFTESEMPDFLIGVHYFGREYDFNNIKNKCNNYGVIFIEDAVHVMMPYGKVGKYGDICIFSPWKLYGLYDGAILHLNSDSILGVDKNKIVSDLYALSESFPKPKEIKIYQWRCKKIIQRIIPNMKEKGNLVVENPNCTKEHKEKPYRISDYSRNLLDSITNEDMQVLIKRKQELSDCIAGFIETKYGIKSLIKDNKMPYAVVLNIPDVDILRKVAMEIGKIGKIVYRWPELPDDIPYDSKAYDIKKTSLMICTHDGISWRRVARKLSFHSFYGDYSSTYKIKLVDKATYEDFTSKYKTPLLQSIVYGEAKQSIQGWKSSLYQVTDDDKCIAVFTVLSKFRMVNRINQGPVFVEEVDTENKVRIINSIKNHFSGLHGLLFIAPNMKKGQSFNALISIGLKYRNKNFSTGFIDLDKEEDILRKQLSSKWRNCLKNAEKRDLIVHEMKSKDEFYQALSLHKADKEKRRYSDSGDDITEYLFDKNALLGLYIKNDRGDIISFMFTALHGKTATYYIGWSNEEGYKSNASRLLLWDSMIMLKNRGYRWFDLGGIDFVNTKGVAEFKCGTGCDTHEYVGEFVAY